MTDNQIKQLKAIVDEFNRAASQPIPGNPNLDDEQKINELAEIINLADMMSTLIEESILIDIPEEN